MSGRTRIGLLVTLHLALSLMPAALSLMPAAFALRSALPDQWFSILLYASCAPTMLWLFWVAMGTSAARYRVWGAIAGFVYQTMWVFGREILDQWTYESYLEIDWLDTYAIYVASDIAMDLLIIAPILLIRRRWAELRFVNAATQQQPRGTVQFSVVQLFGVIAVAATVLGLNRSVQLEGINDNLMFLAAMVLSAIQFAVITVAAPWATLSEGHVGWRVVTVMFLAGALGIAGA